MSQRLTEPRLTLGYLYFAAFVIWAIMFNSFLTKVVEVQILEQLQMGLDSGIVQLLGSCCHWSVVALADLSIPNGSWEE